MYSDLEREEKRARSRGRLLVQVAILTAFTAIALANPPLRDEGIRFIFFMLPSIIFAYVCSIFWNGSLSEDDDQWISAVGSIAASLAGISLESAYSTAIQEGVWLTILYFSVILLSTFLGGGFKHEEKVIDRIFIWICQAATIAVILHFLH